MKQNGKKPSHAFPWANAFQLARAEIADEMRRRLQLARQAPARHDGDGPLSSVKAPRSSTMAVAIGESSRTHG